jgi:hypothetical protein
MTNYYFFASALPELQIGIPPELSFHEFEVMAKTDLKPQDANDLWTLRLYYDILNIRSFWRKEPLSYRGNYDEKELEDALVTREGLPSYVYDFMDLHDEVKDRLHNFSALLVAYFATELPHSKGFLHRYLDFERNLRLVLTALRSKKLGRDIVNELQYEDADDDLIAQIIAQKDSSSYEPPEDFSDLKVIYEEHCEAPLELQTALDEYRFSRIQQLVGVDMFSFDRILGYAAQLIIVEKEFELDKEKGMKVVESIIKDVS